MNWMIRWPGDWPVFVDHAEGAHFTDVDGNEFVDFCLGDTGGMAGHGPKASVDAIAEQAAKGITLMLPTEDAAWVGRGDDPSLRRPLLAVLPDGHRRQPVRAPVGARDHRPAARSSCTTGTTTARSTRRSPSSTTTASLRAARRADRSGRAARADHARSSRSTTWRRWRRRSPPATSRPCCSSPRSRTSGSCCPTRATTRACASSARSTARCW